MLQAETEFVVIGSGPGGATVARQLVRAGRKVLLLERGRDWRTHLLYGTYPGGMLYTNGGSFLYSPGRFEMPLEAFFRKVDVVFPILHGPMGEDGTMQGALKLAGIPFVGSDVLGSTIGMDKDVMKRLLRDARLPVGPFRVLRKHERRPSYVTLAKTLGK